MSQTACSAVVSITLYSCTPV